MYYKITSGLIEQKFDTFIHVAAVKSIFSSVIILVVCPVKTKILLIENKWFYRYNHVQIIYFVSWQAKNLDIVRNKHDKHCKPVLITE